MSDVLRLYWLDGDGFERAVAFMHSRKQVPPELRSFVDAARAMRGGDGGRKPWRRAVIPVTRDMPNGERSGRVFTLPNGVRGIVPSSFRACTVYANELHGEFEAR